MHYFKLIGNYEAPTSGSPTKQYINATFSIPSTDSPSYVASNVKSFVEGKASGEGISASGVAYLTGSMVSGIVGFYIITGLVYTRDHYVGITATGAKISSNTISDVEVSIGFPTVNFGSAEWIQSIEI